MPTSATVQHAALFASFGLALAIIAMQRARQFRKGLVSMVIVMAVGVSMLAGLLRFGESLESETLVVALRELAVLVVAIGLIWIAVVFVFEGLLAKSHVPRLLADVLLALTLVVFALYRMNEVGVNLASIITTSAVLTGVLAFSMQEMLGNLWGGIALQLDNTCRIGDWVRIDGVVGKIIGIRWRCVAVATNDGETVMVPNAVLVKGRVTVLARRGDERIPWRRPVAFFAGYDTAPSRVIALVDDALARAEIPNVAALPAPICTCQSFGDSVVHYVVLYWLADPTLDYVTDSAVRAHVYATLARNGIEIPMPRRVMLTPEWMASQRDVATTQAMASRADLLSRLSLFAALTDAERQSLAAELTDAPYVAGDLISREGDVADSLFILADGAVSVFRSAKEAPGERALLAQLEAPDHFGEMGLLTGQARTATVVARTDALCYRLEKRGFDSILKARPELAETLSHVLAQRLAANDATMQALDEEARRSRTVSAAGDLLQRIRAFFDLSP